MTDAAPTALVFLLLGFNRTQLSFGNGCDLLITPVLPRYLGPFFTPPGASGSGAATAALAVPAGFGGLDLTAQGLVFELVDNNALVFSNAVFLRVGG